MPKKDKQQRRKITGDKGWPVRLAMCESAIRRQDEYLFKGDDCYVVDEVVRLTEARINEGAETDVIAFLCKEGCPRRELLYLLGMCENRGVTNSVKMTGYDSEDLGSLLSDLRKRAGDLWALSGYELGRLLDIEERSTLYNFLLLPEMLHEYASLVEHAVRYIGGRSDFYLNLAKSLLVGFVKSHTGKYYHAKVARLLSVMLGPRYGEVNHRIWYGKHNERLTHYRCDPADLPSLRAKKTLLECRAAILYRMDILHPGKQHLRKEGRTVFRPE